MSRSEALTPQIFNVTITDPNTEYSQALPKGTKHILFQCRTAVDIRYSFEDGKVATPTAPYMTLKSGQVYTGPEKLGFSHNVDEDAPATLYVAAGSGSLVVELLVFKDIR